MLKYPTQRYPTFLPDMLQQQRFLDFSNKIEIVWPLGTCLQKVKKRVKTESVQEELPPSKKTSRGNCILGTQSFCLEV